MRLLYSILIFLSIIIPDFVRGQSQITDSAGLSNPIVPAVNDTDLSRTETVNSGHLPFQTISYDSLFALQQAPVNNYHDGSPHIKQRNVILPLVLLIMLAYVTWLRYVFARELNENITVIVNANLGNQIYRDREFSANIFKLLTFLNFAFVGGVLIYLLALRADTNLPFATTAVNICVFISGIVALYLVKGLVIDLTGRVFRVSNALNIFRFNALVIYHLLGIGLLPLVILGAFAKPPVAGWSLTAALVLVAAAFLIRAWKGISALRMLERFHILYFLLYICALEIAPILIALRLFSMWG